MLSRIVCAIALALLAASSIDAIAANGRTGVVVRVHTDTSDNFELDLNGQGYLYVDISEQVPDASFAAMQTRRRLNTIVISESLGDDLSVADYHEAVVDSMRLRTELDGEGVLLGVDSKTAEGINGFDVIRSVVRSRRGSLETTDVVAVFVDGQRGYQIVTSSSVADAAALLAENDDMLERFRILDTRANRRLETNGRPVRDYTSPTFGYRLRAPSGWRRWADLAEDAPVADLGALSGGTRGMNVLPVCWQGAPPPKPAIYSVLMQQVGEDYPSSFVDVDEDIEKDGATGKKLVGTSRVDAADYRYYHWIVSNESCAYLLYGWGPAKERGLGERLERLWDGFSVGLPASAAQGRYADRDAQRVNAILSNAFGLHLYSGRSYRDAFRFFAAASDADDDDIDYLTNALRSLSAMQAYAEASQWLAPRFAAFEDNDFAISWKAWLGYRLGDADTALALYADLFDRGYRDDEDFTAYTTMLADRAAWDDIDAAYADYTREGETPSHQRLRAGLLQRKGDYADALAILDALVDPQALDPQLAYERLSIMDDMNAASQMLPLAVAVIDAGYGSLRSYFYKGRAEYQLGDYRAAKASFEAADTYAPGNETVRDYLAAVDQALGQGDVTLIATAIDPVVAPKSVARQIERKTEPELPADAAAHYAYSVTGYAFDGGQQLRRTVFQRVHILDDRGVAEFSTLELGFDPAYEQLYVNAVRVYDSDGELLAEADRDSFYITTTTEGYEASTERTAHVPVPALAPGTVIETVVTKLTNVAEGSFPLETVYFSRQFPASNISLFVTGDVDALQTAQFQVPAPKRARDSLIWQVASPLAWRWEPLQPYYDRLLPWVVVGTAADDWESLGREYLEEIGDKLDADTVAGRARKLVGGVDEPARKVEILSAYVQDEIQYKALEFGRRAYIPKAARETLRDRYGDCKDHAVLLHMMLSAVGVDSALALVNLQRQVDPALPSRDQFDHMIVAVRDGGGATRFVDTTDKDLPLGVVPPRYMGGNYALVLDDSPGLEQIGDYAGIESLITVKRDADVREDGTVAVVERLSLDGYYGANLRGQLRDIETANMGDALQRWLNLYLPDAELEDHYVDNVFDPRFALEVELRFTMPKPVGGAITVPGFTEAAYLEYDRVAERRFGFELAYPLKLTSKVNVTVAPGYELAGDASAEQAQSSKFGSWARRTSDAGERVEVEFEFASPTAEFQADDYRPFTQFQRQASRSARIALQRP